MSRQFPGPVLATRNKGKRTGSSSLLAVRIGSSGGLATVQWADADRSVECSFLPRLQRAGISPPMMVPCRAAGLCCLISAPREARNEFH